jgi:hypothetical protein
MSAMKRVLVCLLAALVFPGCTKPIEHDEALAARRAVEFAEVSFVQQDLERGYALLSDAAKRYVPPDKFKETVSRLHPSGRATNVSATEYEPMPGENAIYIYVDLKNSAGRVAYTITMEGTAAADYKVSKIIRADSSFLPSTKDRKRFSKPIEGEGQR